MGLLKNHASYDPLALRHAGLLGSAVTKYWTRQLERSIRPGTLGRNVARCIMKGKRNELESLLRYGLPPWPVAVLLIKATQELLELKLSAGVARRVRAPRAITSRVEEEVRCAALALGRSADRVAAVAAHHVSSERLTAGLDREGARLEQVTGAIRHTREALAELILSGMDSEDLNRTVVVLQWLGEVTQDEVITT
ncbi:MAG: hypothetical protein ACR2JC_00855 [Chloroflexota bacterium]|nr:MAG: hypothetical protein DLM70_10980 [Chloroflexota bacterium]